MAFNPDLSFDDERNQPAQYYEDDDTSDDDMPRLQPPHTRAFLVVPSPAKTVTPIDIPWLDGQRTIADYINSTYVVPTRLSDGHVLYVGEACHEAEAGFFLASAPGVRHAGVGIILGPPDDDGYDTHATRSLIAVLNDITWSGDRSAAH